MKRMSIKRYIILGLLLSFIAILVSFKHEAKIKFATVEFPPYSYIENGEITGLEVEIVKKICEIADIDYDISLMPFSRAYRSVLNFKRTEYDALFNFYKTPKRLNVFKYTEPIIENPIVFFVRKKDDIKFDGEIASIKGKKVGVMRGYVYSQEFSRAVKEDIIEVEKANSHIINFKKLISGRIDIYAVEKFVGCFVVNDMNIQNKVKTLTTPLKIQQGYIGFSKYNPKKRFINRINSALKKMKKNGSYKKIYNKYLDINSKMKKNENFYRFKK
ncbi:MAG: amino acid ABC transporter substrate-binding protein [Candidatus Mcinerneyibacterium aminivorans]|uniref:Amino acid ABC transporter substrate-binding protein n=1 Tax=Candidatus Mcinerneyibacterium aminivorans TaxID=2703815 RepID=A0A5D0MHS9_9BACT|nr:MAG: amino acid ABC transporter substrate-binding protein [Candidatus Mcinerneyibacterium aminivorans]